MDIVLRAHDNPQVIFCSISLPLDATVSQLKQLIEDQAHINSNRLKLYTYICHIKVMIVEGWLCSFFGLANGSCVLVEISHLKENADTNTQELLVEKYTKRRTIDSYLLPQAISVCKRGTVEQLSDIIDKFKASQSYKVPKGEITTFLNKPFTTGWRCIHYVCLNGNLEILKALLSWRVNVNRETEDGWTPLQLCSLHGHFECVKTLLSYPSVDIDKMTENRGTALHLACASGETAVVVLLIENGASMTIEDPNGKIPLELALKPAILEEIPKYMGEQMLKKYTNSKIKDPDMPPSFSGMIYFHTPMFLTDKQVFLVLDVEEAFLYHYKTRESFLDNEEPRFSVLLEEVTAIKNSSNKGFNRSYYYMMVVANSVKLKYNSCYPEVIEQWTNRIKDAVNYWQKRNFKGSPTNKNPIHFVTITRESDNDEYELPRIFTNSPIKVEEDEPLSALNRMMEDDSSPDRNYEIVEEIGVEQLGRLYKLARVSDGNVYTLKMFNKTFLQNMNSIKFALSEYSVLKKIKHPFIILMYKSYQSSNYLYLILEHCPNGTIRNHLDLRKRLDEDTAKFYLAETVLALSFLHKHDIVYRGLKPESIYIDAPGHIRIANFYLAKENVSDTNPTKTFCGAPAYMAPETLHKQGIYQAIDIYSLGSLLYEMLTGIPPYYNEDTQILYKNIKTAKLTFPSFVSEEAKNLIILCMNRNPAKRPTISDIKKHDFFKGTDWKQLVRKQIRPPRLGPEWNQTDNIDEQVSFPRRYMRTLSESVVSIKI
ncbi:unnamed protein product [Blepharisma stoltei]|uniref:Protein kinase domain-containing protein n=1 Tax=Blepharisma stoltei TaxID=1481888 RepID=A0AAU9KD72_9CILI|nr:unnamed protein product [Blepharisma stoltei]